MAYLNDEMRLAVARTLDLHIRNPKIIGASSSTILTAQGIKPNLETVLSFRIGILYGMAMSYYMNKHSRGLTESENLAFMLLVTSRVDEFRESIEETLKEK